MARPKKLITDELVLKAKDSLKQIKDYKLVIRLLAVIASREHPNQVITTIFHISRDTLTRWVRGFRDRGIAGIIDKPKGHNPSKLTAADRDRIAEWLRTGTTAQGEPIHWTLERLRHEIRAVLGKDISLMPLWKQIRALGFRQKVPRPTHAKANPEDQETFKKK